MKWMSKAGLLTIILGLALSAFGQNTRYDNVSNTTALLGGFTNIYITVPNPSVTIYQFPGETVNCFTSGSCTPATTYLDHTTADGTCPLSAQLTLQGSTACVLNGDARGNWGFWAPSGRYQACVSGGGATTQCINITIATDQSAITSLPQNITFGGNDTFSGANSYSGQNTFTNTNIFAGLQMTGGFTKYFNLNLAGMGFAPIYKQVHLTGQTADLVNLLLYNTAASGTGSAGLYRVCFNAHTLSSGTGTTSTVTITWNDGNTKTFTSATWALNSVTVTGQVNGCQVVYSLASQTITVNTLNGTYGTSSYGIDATIEEIN